MKETLWAGARFGKVLETRDYANHVVIERQDEPPLACPEPYPHWVARTFAQCWQVGWVLADPVRLAEPRREAPVMFLSDVVRHLESIHDGVRVLRYMNPDHPDNAVQRLGSASVTLRELARDLARAKGGRSRSEAKLEAACDNLADVNQARATAGTNRVERYQHLRAGGLSVRDIAARDGVTVNAVKCALKRARRIETAERIEHARAQAQWQARLDQRARLTEEQEAALALYDGLPFVHLPDGSIRIDHEDGGWSIISREPVASSLDALLESL